MRLREERKLDLNTKVLDLEVISHSHSSGQPVSVKFSLLYRYNETERGGETGSQH